MQTDPTLAVLLQRMYDAFKSGDDSLPSEIMSQEKDAVGIGTDPREWWEGADVTRAFMVQAPEMHSAGMYFEPGDFKVLSEGSVGWIADRPTLMMPDGSGVPMRLTAVCHREDGAWRMVQFHLSVGLDNEDLLGADLTT